MNNNIRYILKFALGAALAYAVGNAVQSGKISYVLYGASLNIHPIAGDTVSFVRGKVQASAIGAAFGMVIELAFQGNQIAALAIGPALLMVLGYWFNIPRRILVFSTIVVVAAAGNATFTGEPLEFIGLRYWNMFIGSAVGMAVNIFLWPDTGTDKLNPAFAKAIASIRQLYDRTIDDYLQGRLVSNATSRKQLSVDIEKQLSEIDTLMGTAKEELWYPFIDETPYQHWITLQPRVASLFTSVVDLGLAMEGGDGDRLYRGVQTELEALIEATRVSFDRLSRALTVQSSQSFDNPLANLTALRTAIIERRIQLSSTVRQPKELDSEEIKRLSASIYGLWAISEAGTAVVCESRRYAIASELKDLTQAIDSTVVSF